MDEKDFISEFADVFRQVYHGPGWYEDGEYFDRHEDPLDNRISICYGTNMSPFARAIEVKRKLISQYPGFIFQVSLGPNGLRVEVIIKRGQELPNIPNKIDGIDIAVS
jgi:hypothetical protein